jgi:GDP-4-dehydro-6-deoxy-D-mannose reductase
MLRSDDVRAAFAAAGPRSIYHCAGVASVHDSWNDTRAPLEGNVKGTDHLLQAVVASGLRTKILIPGSALVYRPASRILSEDSPVGPSSPYGLSKLAQEMLALRYAAEGLPVLCTRSFTHVGPGQSVSYAASSFAYQIAKIEAGDAPPVIRVGNLDAQRDITDVRDTVGAYRALMARGVPGRIYNVCSGRTHRIAEILDILLGRARVAISVETDESRLRPSDNPILAGDPSRITEDTGWQPKIPVSQTLEDILEYWRHAVVS